MAKSMNYYYYYYYCILGKWFSLVKSSMCLLADLERILISSCLNFVIEVPFIAV